MDEMEKNALLVRCGRCGHVVIIQSILDITRDDRREIDDAITKGGTTEIVAAIEARQCDFGCTCVKAGESDTPPVGFLSSMAMAF